MLRDEVAFLTNEKYDILGPWAALVEKKVNSRFFVDPAFFSRKSLDQLYDSIVRAFQSNQYRELNQTFDHLVEEGHALGVTYADVKHLLLSMPVAAHEVLDERYGERPNYELLSQGIEHCRLQLKSVYYRRGSATAVQVLERNRQQLTQRWEKDLSSEIISPHFAVVGRAEARRFVHDTFDIYLRLLLGEDEELVRDGRDEGVERTRLAAYAATYIDFFELRSFNIADILRAQRHLEALAEPLFFRAYQERAADYRRATQALCEASGALCMEFADGYNDRLMRDYYNEVSIMLHRIKNKLTAVPTSLQTILPQQYNGVAMDGDTLTAEDAKHLSTYEMLRTDCLKSTLDFLQEIRDGDGELPAADWGELAPRLRELADKYQNLREFVQENQQGVAALKRKLETEAILRVEEFLHDALEGGELTTKLTKELQQVQNELYNRERPVWEDLDLRALLREAFEESRVDAKGKRIRYELSMPEQPVPVFAVRRQLKRPLAQVINNALKYTPDGGSVSVELAANDGRALVAVRDTGIGIPAGEGDLVFALCARCTNAQEQNKDGSGTGLYNDRKTVRLHNGEMWVESEGAGKGSTFYIELPLYERVVASAA